MTHPTTLPQPSANAHKRVIDPMPTDLIPEIVDRLRTKAESMINPSSPSLFTLKNPPSLSLQEYIHLIANYSECSEAALVVTTIYLDRIGTKNPDYKICEENVHKLFATAFRLANKFCDDDHFSNKGLARICGITLNDLNQMETKFINDINHELFVDLTEYEEYRKLLS